ncbi:hypothetical protein LNQ52_24545 [Klebsiella pneumoniae subsp. pneumoniae]|nr:hypothetical protein [Klebsiella pneumoniae subsp. pneumoniae]
MAEYVKSQPTLELVHAAAAGEACCSVPVRRRWPEATRRLSRCSTSASATLLASGRANVGVTEHNGVTCLKLTLLNPVVTLDDVKVLLNW